MRYQPTIHTHSPGALAGLQPGQWVNTSGRRGQWFAPGVVRWHDPAPAEARDWPVLIAAIFALAGISADIILAMHLFGA